MPTDRDAWKKVCQDKPAHVVHFAIAWTLLIHMQRGKLTRATLVKLMKQTGHPVEVAEVDIVIEMLLECNWPLAEGVRDAWHGQKKPKS